MKNARAKRKLKAHVQREIKNARAKRKLKAHVQSENQNHTCKAQMKSASAKRKSKTHEVSEHKEELFPLCFSERPWQSSFWWGSKNKSVYNTWILHAWQQTRRKSLSLALLLIITMTVTCVFSQHCTYLIKFWWHFVVGQTTHHVSECARLKMMSHTLNKWYKKSCLTIN